MNPCSLSEKHLPSQVFFSVPFGEFSCVLALKPWKRDIPQIALEYFSREKENPQTRQTEPQVLLTSCLPMQGCLLVTSQQYYLARKANREAERKQKTQKSNKKNPIQKC